MPSFTLNNAASRPSMRSLLLALMVIAPSAADAQVVPPYSRHQPLDQATPPGTAARWANIAGRTSPAWMQPIRIIVDGEAEVSLYHGRPIRPLTVPSPAQMSVMVGHSYRLKVSQMPQLPGVEIFPTIEVIDRLHPPAGKQHQFPIPVYIDRADIELALDGHLVTRVVYLEQPQFAAPFELDEATRTRTTEPTANALSEADRYGRPMLILRLGGRLPDARGEAAAFYGTGGPVAPSRPIARPQPEDQSQPEDQPEPAPPAGPAPAIPQPALRIPLPEPAGVDQ